MSERWQVVNEIHKPARKNFIRRKYKQTGINSIWEVDLADMSKYSKENNKNTFLLMVIDIFSKYLYVVPIKSKNAENVTNAMEKVFKQAKTSPKKIHSDRGTEFYNSKFKKLLDKYNVKLYSTYSEKKAAIVERVIRTLKTTMWKYFSFNGNFKYMDILDKLVSEYNCRKHRTIKMAPKEVNKSNEQMLLNTVYNYRIVYTQKPKFKINDYVRISKYKGIFDKGYIKNWSFEIFQITKIQNTIPVTYLLRDYENLPIAGGFYQYELQKVSNPDIYLVEKILKKKNGKVLVKWAGFPDEKNEWIDAKNMV